MGKKVVRKPQPANKIGEGTAKRMQMKLAKIKGKVKAADDDEIVS